MAKNKTEQLAERIRELPEIEEVIVEKRTLLVTIDELQFSVQLGKYWKISYEGHIKSRFDPQPETTSDPVEVFHHTIQKIAADTRKVVDGKIAAKLICQYGVGQLVEEHGFKVITCTSKSEFGYIVIARNDEHITIRYNDGFLTLGDHKLSINNPNVENVITKLVLEWR